MNQCKDCKFWGFLSDRATPERQIIESVGRKECTGWMERGGGVFGLVVITWSDLEDTAPSVATSAEFGCNQFEPAQPPE